MLQGCQRNSLRRIELLRTVHRLGRPPQFLLVDVGRNPRLRPVPAAHGPLGSSFTALRVHDHQRRLGRVHRPHGRRSVLSTLNGSFN